MSRDAAAGRRGIHRLVAAGIVVAWACTTPGGEPAPGGAFRAEVLDSVAHQAVGPSFEELAAATGGLRDATAAYAAAVADDSAQAAEALEQARAAWREAMVAAQVVELMQLGPAGPSLVAAGGEDLRDELYSWPSVNPCRIDQELVLAEYGDAGFVADRLVNTYGLDALEYLLFYDGPDNTCAPQLPINAEGQWAALGQVELTARRAAYAEVVAAAAASVAEQLAAAWAPGSGPFAQGLAAPGEAGSAYEDVEAAMDELMRVMFYLDLNLKDAKLALPAGILGCSADTCPEGLESLWAGHSKDNGLANLEGFRRLFLGGRSAEQGVGFDDLLVEIGEESLATRMRSDLDAAMAAVEAIDGTFAEALAADPAALDEAHAAVVRITDALKGELPMVLQLTIPSEAAGDAD